MNKYMICLAVVLCYITAPLAFAQQAVKLSVGKAQTIDLPNDASDVLIANPSIVDVGPLNTKKLYIVGQNVGDTNVLVFDQNSQTIANFDVNVGMDQANLARTLRQYFPNENIKAETVNRNVVLSGQVSNPAQAGKLRDLAGRFVGSSETIVDMMTVNGEQQVLLKVKIAEVQRNLLKEFGTDTDIASVNSGNFGLRNTSDLAGKLTKAPFATGSLAYQTGATGPISLTLQALEEKGLLNTLAEPNLTAISGQRAEFLAGGEYPVPVGQSLGTTTIEFRRFGVALGFTPLVLSNNKINLEMETEVSLLSNEARLELEDTSIPSLSVRRAQTTVELASGGSLMIAGIIKSEATNTMSSLPGINKIPIIGQLFSSQSFKRNETELVIFVTAYLVNPIKNPDAVVADDVPVAKALSPQMPQPRRVVEARPAAQITRGNEQPLPKNLPTMPSTVAGGYRLD